MIRLLLAALLLATPAVAQTESEWQDKLCHGPFETEVTQPNGTRVDCISTAYAIEIDFTEKWAEALGQALSYSASTGLRPGIYLVCRSPVEVCHRHQLRLEEAIAHWQLPVTVWAFGPEF